MKVVREAEHCFGEAGKSGAGEGAHGTPVLRIHLSKAKSRIHTAEYYQNFSFVESINKTVDRIEVFCYYGRQGKDRRLIIVLKNGSRRNYGADILWTSAPKDTD